MSGILEGMQVIEGSAFVAAPLGGMTLAQLGADVIRFDAIGGGLDYDRWPVTAENRSLFWDGLNKGKRSIAIDLRSPRGQQIVTDLMRFAKPEPPDPVLQPLRGVLEPLCQHWRESSSLPDDQLTLFLADTKVMVNADAEQLGEILERVLANAVLATQEIASVPEGGRVPRVHINSPSRVSDETVRIVIEDNGVGMTRDVLEHAVDPFFSARPAGRGRGLGLSQAYRLAEVNGGRLWLESTPDVGTTVTIELPAR